MKRGRNLFDTLVSLAMLIVVVWAVREITRAWVATAAINNNVPIFKKK